MGCVNWGWWVVCFRRDWDNRYLLGILREHTRFCFTYTHGAWFVRHLERSVRWDSGRAGVVFVLSEEI